MKKIVLILTLLFSTKAFSQVYQLMNQYGYNVTRMNFDSTLQIPTVCGVPTLKTVYALKKSALAFDSCNNRFYYYNPKTTTWSIISGGGGGATDTTSLSNRINLKVNISDTAAMLTPYLKKVDTTSLSNRINSKLSIVDTNAMLTPYLKKIDTTNKFVNSVTSLNDSTFRVEKGGTMTDITIRSSATVTDATRLITQVYNKSGATITKGSVIYIDGAHSSNLPSIALAKANIEQTSAYTFGLVVSDIANNSQGTVIQNGSITNLNLPTSTYTDGQTLYLSPTIAGGFTLTKPLAPYHYVAIGTITRAHPTQGTIQVAIRNGFQLDELSDVSIALTPNDSTLLQFSRVDSLWHDVSVTNAIGTKYLKPADTTTIIATKTNVAAKVNISDTAAMLTKYMEYVDSAAMLSKYLRIIDTSSFQRKNIGAYSFQANKTNVAANTTSNAFRDTSGTYTGSITWVGTAPSGTSDFTYRWTQIGKCVNLNINLYYGTAGASCTQVTMTLPSDCPTPLIPSSMNSALRILYYGSGNITSNYQIGGGASRAGLRLNAANTGYELTIIAASLSAVSASINIQYYTN
jgi:archaellum component FlaF (FlaF/FlaG flagellin family)